MYNFFSKKIVNKLVENNLIKSEEAELYEYCFILLISTLTSILSLLIIAVFTNTLFYSSIILLSFLVCRLCCGGYHANHHLTCYIITILNHISCLFLLLHFCKTYNPYLIGCINLISFLLLFLFSPIENKNNPLSDKQKTFHKIQCRLIAIINIIISFIPIYIPNSQLGICSFSIGVFSASFSMIISLIKELLEIKFRGGVFNEKKIK